MNPLDYEYPIKMNKSVGVIDTTKLIDYTTCPRKFLYSHVLGWRTEFESYDLIFGRVWHLLMAELEFNPWVLDNMNEEGVYELFRLLMEKNESASLSDVTLEAMSILGMDHYVKIWEQNFIVEEEVYPKTTERAMQALLKYMIEYHDTRKKYRTLLHNDEPMVEVSGKTNLNDDFVIHFRLDKVVEDEEGKVYVVDYKSGKKWRFWELSFDLSPQIGTYSHVIYTTLQPDKVGGILIDGILFNSLTKDVRKSDMLDPFRHIFLQRLNFNKSLNVGMSIWYASTVNKYTSMMHDFEQLSKSSPDDHILYAFPLRETSCFNYNQICKYKNFCELMPNPLGHSVPAGFVESFWNPTEEPSRVVLK